MTFARLFQDLILLFTFLLAGFVIREFVKPLQRFYIPASIVGGVLALVLGPQVLGWVEIPKSFSSMAGVMITLVLTASVIGVNVDKDKLSTYLIHLCITVSLYGMQMFVGCGLGSIMEKSGMWPDLPFGWGSAAVFSFWGGHGTAAGAGKAWEHYNIIGNTDIGMVMSTLGVIACFVFGMLIINIGVRKGWATQAVSDYKADPSFFGGLLPENKRAPIGVERVPSTGVDNFSFQLAIVLFCMFLGNKGMGYLKSVIPQLKPLPGLMNGILAGMLVWSIIKRTPLKSYVDRRTINTISGLGLEITIVSAVATINLKLITVLIVPILVMSAVIVLLTALLCQYLSKKFHRTNWFEKYVGLFGAATGSVPTGLALIRCVDPNGQTDAADTLAIGNSLWAPVYGSMPALLPMIAMTMGVMAATGLGFALMVVPIVVLFVFFRQ